MATCKLCNAPPLIIRPIDKIMANIRQQMNIPTDPYHAIRDPTGPTGSMGPMNQMHPMNQMGPTGPFRPKFHGLTQLANQIVYPGSQGVTGTAIAPQ
jgi:hypothetical protein